MKFEQKVDGTIRVIHLDGTHDSPTPEVGKIYPAFDDGKIRMSRLMYYKIEQAFDLDNPRIKQIIGTDLWDTIRYEINACYWLYEPEQHIVYLGRSVDENGKYDADIEPSVFLRTKDGEWFGTGFWSCLLDTDNYYYNMMMEDMD